MTPELFTAYALTKSGCIALGVIPCLIVLPLLAPVVLILAILTYFKTVQSADEKLKAKREEIEMELPRFVATITQEIKASRDVLGLMDHYKRNAGAVFGSELDILTADMRSSSYEAALTRLSRGSTRRFSQTLSEVDRRLRGDDGRCIFKCSPMT
jgi:Flp pilus assembly protein TadB